MLSPPLSLSLSLSLPLSLRVCMYDAVLVVRSNTRICDHGLVQSDSNAVVSFNTGFWPECRC